MSNINKVIIIMVSITVVLIAIVLALVISQNTSREEATEIKETKVSEVILDDCTDEYEMMQNEVVKTNTEEEKISPNCRLIVQKKYNGCNDTINEYMQMPQKLVNASKEELQKEYKDWQIKEFTPNQVTIYKEYDGECGEHFILKENEGKIDIYKIDEQGKQTIYEKTEISTTYLPEKDKLAIAEGLKVNSEEKLNEIIESFE
ncbi:MAG: BofC C-terminal domain-containing protein [Clostridia bacterium]|nr:BofC C-terminal domain-containing protein [Clostridia bacterium]